MQNLPSESNVRAGFPTWTIPPALLLLCILTFGLMIPWLGLYWDDWPTLWYYHLFGPAGFREIFSIDRPVLGEIFFLTSQIGGTSIAAWQWLSLIARWISCLALWWSLLGFWPGRYREVTFVALLFAVYPGFLQQPISVTYNQGWITMTTLLLSYGFMAWGIHLPARRFWLYYCISVLLAGLSMFTDEYFFGLEIMRPVILWFLLAEAAPKPRQRLQRAALTWSPYLLVMGVFLYWRILLRPNPRGEIQLFNQLITSPIKSSVLLVWTILQDFVQTGLLAWAQIFNPVKIAQSGVIVVTGFILITLITGTATIFYLRFLLSRQTKEFKDPAPSRWARQAIFLGCLALLAGGWPFWITNFPIELHFPWDRFTLAMMLGSSLLIAGLVVGIMRSPLKIILSIGLLVGLSAGFHLYNNNLYRLEWNQQKDFFWQLTWRAPVITANTVVLTAGLPFTYYSDNSLTAPLNWTYAPQNTSHEMSYQLYAAEARLGLGLKSFEKDIPIHQPYRTILFNGNTSQAISVYYSPPGCLLLLDPAVHSALPQKPNFLREVITLSNPDLVSASGPAARPPVEIFGKEPAHQWCYYFEKADLARQMGDWQQITRLGEQALGLGTRLYEVNAPEILPYIEGYAHMGKWEKAAELTNQAFKLTFRMRGMLCSTWKRLEQTTQPNPQRETVLKKVQNELSCEKP